MKQRIITFLEARGHTLIIETNSIMFKTSNAFWEVILLGDAGAIKSTQKIKGCTHFNRYTFSDYCRFELYYYDIVAENAKFASCDCPIDC